MSDLLAVIGPKVIGIMALVLAALGWGFQQRIAGAKAERNKQKAKEADSYAKHIQEVERAAAAKPRLGVSVDPNNRDNE